MKPASQTRKGAFTRIELLAIVVAIALAAVLVAPAWSRVQAKRNRIQCVDNLKNIGLSIRIWSTDSSGGFPWSYSTNRGGSLELLENTQATWRHFATLSNELSDPKLVWCPTDKGRKPAASFTNHNGTLSGEIFGHNGQISYFLGLDATEEEPQAILAGDRNVTTNGIPLGPGRQVVWAGTRLGFTEQMHDHAGNILLGDGSVQQVTDGRFTALFADAIKSTGLTTNVWLVP